MQSFDPGQSNTITYDAVKTDGTNLTTGTLSVFLYATEGPNQGFWWTGSTWADTQTSCGNATYVSQAQWTITIDAAPFDSTAEFNVTGLHSTGTNIQYSEEIVPSTDLSGVTTSPSADKDTLIGIRTTWRECTGLSQTTDISDIDLNARLNAYLSQTLPKLVGEHNLRADLTQELTATDSGEYTMSAVEVKLEEPVTINNIRVRLYQDKKAFWDRYPDTETIITAPGLSIGTLDTADVNNSEFTYKIGQWTYTFAAGENSLTGNTVPHNKYGAWSLSADNEGNVTINEASDNAVGYLTSGLAIRDISVTNGDESCYGYVTVINTSGTFVPGTTKLDASGVTATFTDGNPLVRSTPEAVLVDGRTMYVRPKPYTKDQLKCRMVFQRPAELVNDSDTTINEEWGYATAYGDAALYLLTTGDTMAANEIAATRDYYINSIRKDYLLQLVEKKVERAM